MKIQEYVIREEPKEKSVKALELRNVDILEVNENEIKFIDIEPVVSYKYAGDFYALLLELKIPKEEFLRTLALNGLTSPDQWEGKVNYIAYI